MFIFCIKVNFHFNSNCNQKLNITFRLICREHSGFIRSEQEIEVGIDLIVHVITLNSREFIGYIKAIPYCELQEVNGTSYLFLTAISLNSILSKENNSAA